MFEMTPSTGEQSHRNSYMLNALRTSSFEIPLLNRKLDLSHARDAQHISHGNLQFIIQYQGLQVRDIPQNARKSSRYPSTREKTAL